MNMILLSVSDLVPYEKNPRKNDGAVKYVAESIRQFGFKVPLVVDRDNVVITGHTRLKAAKKLGITEVPCIVADDLSDEQIRAFRLADNKVAEHSEWDYSLLDDEIGDILDIDMADFGFEFELPDLGNVGDKKNERLRTDEEYNLPYVDLARCEGYYQMPIIAKERHIPQSLIGFNYVLSTQHKRQPEAGVHFYIDDYQFERIWNEPHKYIDILRGYDCVLSPDFSLYMDMPISMKIWNVFRSRLIGQMMQDAGITVIPTVQWAEEETFEFCFDGIQEGSVVSVSSVGVKNSKSAMEVWRNGTQELILRKKPSCIVLYGGDVEFDFGNVRVKRIANSVTERMKKKTK